jgi:DNA-binding NtrC family response regulator
MDNILIVAEDKALRQLISVYLRFALEDYNILAAENRQKAIEVLKTNPVCLVLVDLETPNTDGDMLLEYVKRNHPSIPVIALTGDWPPSGVSRAPTTRAVHYIEKPVDFKECARMVMELLEKEVEESSVSDPNQAVND